MHSDTFGDAVNSFTPAWGHGISTPGRPSTARPNRTATGPLPICDSRHYLRHNSRLGPDFCVEKVIHAAKLCTYPPPVIHESTLVTATGANGCPRRKACEPPPCPTPVMCDHARLARICPVGHLLGVKQTPETATPAPPFSGRRGNRTSCRRPRSCAKIRSARDALMRRPLSRPPGTSPLPRGDRAPESSRGERAGKTTTRPRGTRRKNGPITAPEQIREPETS